MKKKLTLVIIAAFTICLICCAFTVDSKSSVKTLTKPYINTYECTLAEYGGENLLEEFEYLKLTFLDDKELELSFKTLDGKKYAYKRPYTFDDKDNSFETEIGIFGYDQKQKIRITEGSFTVCMPIMNKPLVMIFKAQ